MNKSTAKKRSFSKSKTSKELIELNVKIKLLARAILEIDKTLMKGDRVNPYLIKDLEKML